jgi:ABC-type antimicrobial peptide transport system permease subunit
MDAMQSNSDAISFTSTCFKIIVGIFSVLSFVLVYSLKMISINETVIDFAKMRVLGTQKYKVLVIVSV